MTSSRVNDRYTIRVSDPSELEGIGFGAEEAFKEPVIDVDDTDVVMVPPPPSSSARRRSDRQAAITSSSTPPKRTPRRRKKEALHLSINSPALVQAREITNQLPHASLVEKLKLTSNSVTKLALLGALQPNDVLETIHALGTLQEFKCKHANVHDIFNKKEYYPLNLVFGMPQEEPIHINDDDDESPPVKKQKKSKNKSHAKQKQPCLISLLSSDEEDDGDTDMVHEETKLPAETAAPVSKVSAIPAVNGNDCTHMVRPDPTPGYQVDEWVLTPVGPGRIDSYRVDRFSESLDSLVNPLLVYQVSLCFGTLVISAQDVHPFEGSAFANQVIVSNSKVSLSRGDVLRLQPNTYLNDNLVNFFIHQLPKPAKIHVFSSYFYTRIHDLSQGQDKTTPEFQSTLWHHLKGWIKHVDIWDKYLLLLPIHDREHWSLLVICHIGSLLHPQNGCAIPCLLHLDSGKRFRLHNYIAICARLRVFIQVCLEKQHGIQRILTKQDLPGGSPPVPAQANETDCGMYMLEWMERFLTDLKGFRVTKEFIEARGNMAPFGRMVFPQSRIDYKRNEFQSLLYTMSTTND